MYKKIKKLIINSERLLVGLTLLFITLPVFWCVNYDKLAEFVRKASSILCLIIAFILVCSPVMTVHPIRTFTFFIYASIVVTIEHSNALAEENI